MRLPTHAQDGLTSAREKLSSVGLEPTTPRIKSPMLYQLSYELETPPCSCMRQREGKL